MFETSAIDNFTSLPPFDSTIPTSLHASTISPTYSNIMDQPITSLFPSQSTEGPKSVPNDNTEEDDIIITFANIKFHQEEENIPDHMLMFAKQFKILNRTLKSLLQRQADVGIFHSGSEIEFNVMLKSQELCLKSLMEQIFSKTKKCLKQQSDLCVHEEDVNLKIEEIRSEMVKEVVNLDHNYSTLNMKVDIVPVAFTKVVKLRNSLSTKFEAKSTSNSLSFAKLEKLLGDLKDLLLKLGYSQ
ncbi:unnamed protein product [Lactuca saligna]|uniref:Uncharacterized protein n=1 Tax=Lactuca saligna TaxID=75948 RepID=A0AA35YWE1_LACSI|nr:unnamed protein product [Lactuca saligna]CAI9281369.1 unnamed protein product [Lactuca saligna]